MPNPGTRTSPENRRHAHNVSVDSAVWEWLTSFYPGLSASRLIECLVRREIDDLRELEGAELEDRVRALLTFAQRGHRLPPDT